MRVCVIASLADSLLHFRGLLLSSMVRQGHEVTACAPWHGADVVSRLAQVGVRYRRVSMQRTGMNAIQDAETFVMLRRILRSEQPDVVFSYTIKPVIYGSLAARAVGVPAIFSMVTGLGFAFLGRTLLQRCAGFLVRPMYRFALQANRRVFFHNRDDRTLFEDLRLLRNSEQAVVVNGSGVDLDHFGFAAPLVTPITFLFVGRLYVEKGVVEYVEAARSVKEKHPEVRFRLVGGRDSNPSAISEGVLQKWRSERIVECVGWVDDVRPELVSTSVFVLPSYREGTPRSVLEAMSMGRPIVTTDAPGCRETVVRNENGFLVPVGDAHALAQAMERFIAEPELIVTMGRRSREIAVKKFDVNSVNRVMLTVMGLHGCAA